MTESRPQSSPRWTGLPLLSTGLVVLWSSGFIGAEIGTSPDLAGAPATTLLAWRFLLVAALLGALALVLRRRMDRRDVFWHAAIGLLTQAGYLWGVGAAAEQGVAAGTSALIAALQPIVGAYLASLLLGERVARTQALGLGIGVVGVALVVGGDLGSADGASAWAHLLPLAAMLALVAGTLVERRARPSADLLPGLAVQTAVSAVLFAVVAAATGTIVPPAEPLFWAAVVWLALLSNLGAYALYWMVLARSNVARVSGLLYLTPPTTMLWAWAMFGATPTAAGLAGLAVCAGAVALIGSGRGAGSGRGDRRPAAREPAE